MEIERPIGVLYLDSQEKGTLDSPVTVTALETLANEAAVAIENARLYREALEKARMEQELRIAADMQQALLPPRARSGTGFEAAGEMSACRDIGGDFFDYLELPGDRIGFVLCDVSGKGAPAALLTAMIQGIFRDQAEDGRNPADTLERANRVLSKRAVRSRYATGFYGVLSPDGTFVCSNAGHNPPILVRASGEVTRLEKGGAPIGLFAGMKYDEESVLLQTGDTLVIFSDGVSEAENAAHDDFSDDRLIECVTSSRTSSPSLILDSLLHSVREFAAGCPQSDDMTALVIRANR